MYPCWNLGEDLGLKIVLYCYIILPALEAKLQNTVSSHSGAQNGKQWKTRLMGTTTKCNHAQYEYSVHVFHVVLLLAVCILSRTLQVLPIQRKTKNHLVPHEICIL